MTPELFSDLLSDTPGKHTHTTNPTNNTKTMIINQDHCPVHPKLQEDLILIKYELGIKETRNGERDKQMAHAWKRINAVGKKAEEEDKTIKEDLDDVKEDIGEIKGELKYISWFVKLITLLFLVYIAYFSFKTFILGY